MAPQMFTFKAALLLALLSWEALASIGPVATLNIANANIGPDGFTRSAVLAGGTFPGPIIAGNKVNIISVYQLESSADGSI